jgi:autotransporter-associated beta strand protein
MYWGNSEAADSSDGTAVFTTDNNFSGVWHLDESSDTLSDATGNGYDGIRNGNVTQSTGEIGYGQLFDSSKGYIGMGNVLNPETSNFTVSTWLKRDSLSSWQVIFGKTNGGSPSSTYGWIFDLNESNNKLDFFIASGGSNWGEDGTCRITQTESISDTTTWHHVAVVIDRSGNSACGFYIDGVFDPGVKQDSSDITSVGTVSNSIDARIGLEADNEFPFIGSLDEMVFSTTARSADWIKLCYENQKADQSLIQTSGTFTWMDQDGNWGDDAQWSPDSTILTMWPGHGYDALFETDPDDEETVITVTDTQYVDSITFAVSGYRIEGDVLYLSGADGSIHTDTSVDSAVITAECAGGNGLTKSGAGTLVLDGDNTYSGNTFISDGTLVINGTTSDQSDFTVSSGATLAGNGTVSGGVDASGASIVPGYNGTGTLTFGSLTLDNTSQLSFDIGDLSDTLIITGDLALDGTITFSADEELAAGDYLLIFADGTITNDSLDVTPLDNGFTCKLIYTDSTVAARLTDGLIVNAPSDTIVANGAIVDFSVTAEDDGTLSFLWQRSPEDSVADTDTFSLNPATLADSGRYRCIVTDNSGSDTCEWFHVSVLDTPKIATQPAATDIHAGESGSLWLTMSTNEQEFAWYKSEDDQTVIGTGAALAFDDASLDDAGAYYCLVSNAIATISSDTVTLTVIPASIQAYYTFTPSSGIAPFTVTFTDSSIGTIEKRQWDFGDDSTDTTICPQHTFDNAGIYSVSLAVEGPEGLDTLVREDAVTVYSTNDNPLSISGTASGEDTIIVTIGGLDNAPVSLCDSIGLWIAADTIPRSLDDAQLLAAYAIDEISKPTFTDTLIPGLSDPVIGILTGLFWDDDTIAPIDIDNGTVIQRNSGTVTDTGFGSIIELTSLSFDSSNGQIRVSWCIDTSRCKGDMDIGTAYSLYAVPDSDAINWTTVYFEPCMDTVLHVNEPLRFESLYYVRLFIRKTGESWVSSAETASDTVRTGKPFRQIVNFFDEHTGDTVGIFNRQITLWKDPSISGTTLTTDTVQIHTSDPPDGFTTTGTALHFTAANSRPSFYIGFHIDSLPSGHSLADVRIYHDSAGIITVEHDTRIDSAGNMVYLRTSPTKNAFIPMIDTRAPVATAVPFSDSIVHPENDISDTVRIQDNVFNVKWVYLYSKGDEAPTPRDSGILNDTDAVQPFSISHESHFISSEYGVRILLAISDGINRDTITMSRSVFRESSDPLFTREEMWHPVYPTAHLFSSDPESLLIDKVDSSEVSYDKRFVRLFRWVEIDSNRFFDEKWVEYDPGNSTRRDLFSIAPGRLLWIKTRKSTLLHLGDGYTLSLTDTFSLELPAKQFTDFGIPYRFPIRLRSILDASSAACDSLQYYIWERDSITDQYKAVLFYLTTMPDRKDASVELTSENSGAYTVYNHLDRDITLRIPPIPTSMASSDDTPSAKKHAESSWSVKLHAVTQNGFSLPPVYLGYTRNAPDIPYPVAPSFSGNAVYLFDRTLHKKQGHYIAGSTDNGLLREVHFRNTTSSPVVYTCSFSSVGAFPETFSARLFDIHKKQLSDKGTITVEANSVASRWISVGDEQWHKQFLSNALNQRYRLHNLYPNPARSLVSIRYSVPFGADDHITLSVFDVKGRRVWKKEITAMLSSGIHHTTWNGRDTRNHTVGAGMYIVRFTVTDKKGKSIHRSDQCITYFP